jgi:hypothetical protein
VAIHWDNIKILQAIDEEQERLGGAELWGIDGRQLMDKIAGTQIIEDKLVRGFARELLGLASLPVRCLDEVIRT